MSIVFASVDKAPLLLLLAAQIPTLKHIIIMNAPSSVSADLIAGNTTSIVIIHLVDIETKGSLATISANPPTPTSIATLCYTSGTTGLPKGVVLTHSSILAFSGGIQALQLKDSMYNFTKDDVHLSYLPLAHVFERCIQVHLMYIGASWGFFQGDPLKLMDDACILKPTRTLY